MEETGLGVSNLPLDNNASYASHKSSLLQGEIVKNSEKLGKNFNLEKKGEILFTIPCINELLSNKRKREEDIHSLSSARVNFNFLKKNLSKNPQENGKILQRTDNINNNYPSQNNFQLLSENYMNTPITHFVNSNNFHKLIGKNIQKEVIKKILTDFCSFLSRKGYTIIKRREDINMGVNKNKLSLNKKKAWLCEHINRTHYARGKCQNCYLNFYHRQSKQKERGAFKNDPNQTSNNNDSKFLEVEEDIKVSDLMEIKNSFNI